MKRRLKSKEIVSRLRVEFEWKVVLNLQKYSGRFEDVLQFNVVQNSSKYRSKDRLS